MGCTTGAIILDKSQTMIAFKNKDHNTRNFKDKIFLDHENAFGVCGLDLQNEKASGFSIGVNKYGLVALNSHVLTTLDPTYDLITQNIVFEAKNVDEAIEICKREIKESKKYQWCNMVIATNKELAAIELATPNIAVDRSRTSIVRTNHHLMLNSDNSIIDYFGEQSLKNSKIRYNDAAKILSKASDKMEIESLLKSHNQSGAICRHGNDNVQDVSCSTVYSYLVTIQMKTKPQIVFEVIKGSPCSQSYRELEIDFPLNINTRPRIQKNYPFQ
jgi:hypothetical protein